MPTTALIYCRVSSDRQRKEGQGLDSQEHRCRVYAAQKGYVVDRVFQDSFTGGGNFMDRPAMKALLGYVDEHGESEYVVIFDDLKRFARDTLFHWSLRQAFRQRRIKPECLNFNFEDTPEGEFIETILAAQGELERKQNRRQVIQKQRARLERGYWPFFPPPGYKGRRDATHGRLLMPDEPRASLIREAFQGFASGRFERHADVLSFLQKNGFFSARASQLGYIEDVSRLLTRVIYAGDIEYQPWGIPRRIGHHEPLVSRDTFDRVQTRIAGNERPPLKRVSRDDFPLRRFVICARCRRPYTASWTTKSNGRRFAYYRCRTPICEERNRSIRGDVLHEHFLEMLSAVQPAPSTLSAVGETLRHFWTDKTTRLLKQQEAREAELHALQEDIGRTADRLSRTRDDHLVGIYEEQLSRLARREAVLKECMTAPGNESTSFETALSRVLKYFTDLCNTWKNADARHRAFFIRVVFEGLPAYDRRRGFETAILSLPFRQSRPFAGPLSHGVDTEGGDLKLSYAQFSELGDKSPKPWPTVPEFRTYHPDYASLSDTDLNQIRERVCSLVIMGLNEYFVNHNPRSEPEIRAA